MTYTATITSKGQVTIPKPIRELLKSDSRKISFVKENDKIVIKPAPDFLSLKNSISSKPYSDKKADQEIGQYIKRQYEQKD